MFKKSLFHYLIIWRYALHSHLLKQNMGKERENSYQKLNLWRKGTHKHMETYLKYFDGHRCLSQSEESKCMWLPGKDCIRRGFLKGATPGGCERGGNGGRIKWKLSKVNTRAVSIGQNELIRKFKMAVGDVITIRGQFVEYTHTSVSFIYISLALFT